MVQIVFIHGVNVRKEPDENSYNSAVATRHAAFEKYCFKQIDHTFHDPYWGNEGAHPRLGGKYLATPKGSTLAIGGIGASHNPEPSARETRLLDAARDDFESVLNTLAIILADESAEPFDPALAEKIADYIIHKENDEGSVQPPDWLSEPDVNSDRAFVDRLESELNAADDIAVLGLGNVLKKAAGKVLGAGLNLVDSPIEKLVRSVTPKLAQFLGDAFVYLKNGEKRDAIREVITQDLVKAASAAKANNENLIVIGHSMGANVFYDMITDPDWLTEIDDSLGHPFRPDMFLSVGTQLGLFEELNLFKHSTSAGIAPFPERLGDWWHVYNRMDVLSFAAKDVFEGVKQFSVDTKANIVEAHGAYFVSPVFQKRLRKRLLKGDLISE